MRAVFDTVIFVRGLLNPLSIWGRLVFERYEDYRLIVSPPVLREVLEVVDRPTLARRFRFVAGMDKARLLALLADAEVVVVDEDDLPRVCRDPNDDMFLATAVAGGARFIVSEDNDLLALGEYDGVRVVNAEAFLAVLGPDADRSGA